MLKRKWPEAEKILDMKFSDQGNVDLETVISRQPDLMIAQLRAKPSLVQTGVLAKLDALHIPVIFVDYELHPVENTLPSIALLGKVMGQTARAQAYMDFYQQRLDRIHQRLATTSKKPLVFIEPIAGVGGLDNGCCFTHARNGWGGLVEAAGRHQHRLAAATGGNREYRGRENYLAEPGLLPDDRLQTTR
ncbi:ferrichrome/ferrioxamine B periplasmic transporter [Leclercia adecarboxylata]|uniref:Ferrichrome/ferrioxamine B periplasmic transporter n=1 Tax=Leclercia adecarboxylata TaxID=83655 RepID=A0A4U9HIL7_9ENTR|nr:ferrichrome/ferrioxamine B periplasmic transporter [Leclercia adecarboxylata]